MLRHQECTGRSERLGDSLGLPVFVVNQPADLLLDGVVNRGSVGNCLRPVPIPANAGPS